MTANKLEKRIESEQKGFAFLNVTQFFGAANDNVLKQVLIFGLSAGGLWAGALGEGAQAYASLALAIPFVVLSGFAGQFSDRYSKRSVCVVFKWVEVLVAAIAMLGLFWQNVWVVMLAMVLLSIQSTFFTPAKFGILPEITDEGNLSRANGTINMFTYVAIILGSAVGGIIYDAYNPDLEQFPNANPMLWLPGLVLLLVAAGGAWAALGIPKVQPSNPDLKIRATFIRTYLDTWNSIKGTALASAIVSWSLFYLIVGGVAILILPDYKELLKISATKASLLMAVLGVAIGVGDFVAGRISGHGVRTSLIPIGAIPVTVMFFMLAFLPLEFYTVAIGLSATGFLAGFVMVPLQTMTQYLSPDDELGKVLGLWNCLSFVGIIVGNLMFLGLKQFDIPSHRVFILCGILSGVFVLLHFVRWKQIFDTALTEKAN